MSYLESLDYKGYKIDLYQDDNPESPREWSNLGHMVCFTSARYELGDKHDLNQKMFSGWVELEKFIMDEKKAIVILPLFIYEHSGMRMQTTPFNDPWDSAKVGFIYATLEDIRGNYPEWIIKDDLLNPDQEQHIIKVLEGEVDIYDQWLMGDVYGFVIKQEKFCDKCKCTGEEVIDSCWGYYGMKEVLEEAKGTVDYRISKGK